MMPSVSDPALDRPVEILLVEDNDDDFVLTREGFERAKLSANLQHVTNGKECLAYLRKESDYADAPTPDLILLDLNMPVMDGREVLTELVDDNTLKHIPVVILTTSIYKQDVLDMYQLRCNGYIVKPVDFDEFLNVIEGIANFWFTLARRPKNTP